jgi:hypothetical protein
MRKWPLFIEQASHRPARVASRARHEAGPTVTWGVFLPLPGAGLAPFFFSFHWSRFTRGEERFNLPPPGVYSHPPPPLRIRRRTTV